MSDAMCAVTGCPRKADTRGWCRSCYRRELVYGDPTVVRKVHRHDPESAAQMMRDALLRPLVPYSGHVADPWPCLCERCGSEVAPSLMSIRAGQGGCRFCGHKKPDDSIGYTGTHARLRRQRGLASDYACVDCGGPAEDWSYEGGSADERISESDHKGCAFTPDLSFYSPRCTKCHGEFDGFASSGKRAD